MSVRLLTSMPSPQPVGTVIGLTPHVDNAQGMLVFRYSVREGAGPLHVIRDFSQQRDYVWRPALYEHEATVRVTVRNNGTKETAEGDLPSGRKLKSIIAGIRSMVAVFDANTVSSAPTAGLFTSRRH